MGNLGPPLNFTDEETKLPLHGKQLSQGLPASQFAKKRPFPYLRTWVGLSFTFNDGLILIVSLGDDKKYVCEKSDFYVFLMMLSIVH